MPKETIHAKGLEIGIYTEDFENEFISLTDIARYQNIEDPRFVVRNWMRNRDVVELLGLWEMLHNPNFNRAAFGTFKNEAGKHAFVISPEKWINETGAIGMINKRGRYGSGTYAHSDLAMSFATWVSPEFQLYILKDYRRLKAEENSRLSLGWNLNREISKLNYRIHTDAIKNSIIPSKLTPRQIKFVYADEADVLNVALFGMTAREWRSSNPNKKGNIRDYATVNQLLILANLESYNAILISQEKNQSERLVLLREVAVRQMQSLSSVNQNRIDGATS